MRLFADDDSSSSVELLTTFPNLYSLSSLLINNRSKRILRFNHLGLPKNPTFRSFSPWATSAAEEATVDAAVDNGGAIPFQHLLHHNNHRHHLIASSSPRLHRTQTLITSTLVTTLLLLLRHLTTITTTSTILLLRIRITTLTEDTLTVVDP